MKTLRYPTTLVSGTAVRAFLVSMIFASVIPTSSAQSLQGVQRENAELRAAFDLMVKQLAAKDRELQLLRERVDAPAQSEELPFATTLGCPVEEAGQLIAEESFIFYREQALLKWLTEYVSSCKLMQLRELDTIASEFSLSQSRASIVQELESRGEDIPENTTLGMPLLDN